MITYISQFIICVIATISFAIIFSAPKSELIFCGISGALGWVFYLYIVALGGGTTLGNAIGAIVLTLFSRYLATIRKKPVTIYLITGIFPLVPGAGIYYTAYYLIMNEMENFSHYGLFTIKTAGAIVIGIILGMAPPQSFIRKSVSIFSAPFGRK